MFKLTQKFMIVSLITAFSSGAFAVEYRWKTKIYSTSPIASFRCEVQNASASMAKYDVVTGRGTIDPTDLSTTDYSVDAGDGFYLVYSIGANGLITVKAFRKGVSASSEPSATNAYQLPVSGTRDQIKTIHLVLRSTDLNVRCEYSVEAQPAN